MTAQGTDIIGVADFDGPDLHRIESILKDDVITSMVIGLLPFPAVDTVLLMALQVKMVEELCREYRVPFSRHRAAAAVSAVVGALPVASALGITSLIKSIPLFGSIAGGATVTVMAGALTYAQGRLLVQHFESGGTLLNFDPRRLRSELRRELRQGQAVASRALRDDPRLAHRRGGGVPAPVPGARQR